MNYICYKHLDLLHVFFFSTDNCIDEEAMKLLNEENVKQLIPKIGLRVKFLNKWKLHV